MCDVLSVDREIIDKERSNLDLPKPIDFSDGDIKGRITPELIDRLMPLLLLPFDQSAVEEANKGGGYKAKGVPYALQLARLQEIFGTSHIDITHEVIEEGKIERDEKNSTFFCEVLVTLRIGNHTFYINSTNNKPDSSFVPYYKVTGIGFEGNSATKGGAKKNAVANGLKDCFRTMGMLRYLYLDDDNDEGSNSSINENKTQVVLLETPNFYSTGTLFMKCKAKDITKGNENEIELIVYRNNQYNQDEHQQMIDLLNQYKSSLVINKELNVSYKENLWKDQTQYIINKVYTTK